MKHRCLAWALVVCGFGALLGLYAGLAAARGALCARSESPDGAYVLEARRSPFSLRLFAMPGDGGCSLAAGRVMLRNASGAVLRSVRTDDASAIGRVEWSDTSVSFDYADGDLKIAEWPLR